MSIGEHLKSIRIQKGMTQAELADRIGVSRPFLCQIERGTKALSVPLAKEIAVVLRCDIETLAQGE